MKRSPLARRVPLRTNAPLKPGGMMKRRARLAPMNRERRDRMWAEQFHSEEYVEFVHATGCCIPGCDGRPVQACHAKSRASGGTWRDLVGMCADHHSEQHTLGVRTFQAKHGICLDIIARVLAGLWLERGGSEPASDSAGSTGRDRPDADGPTGQD